MNNKTFGEQTTVLHVRRFRRARENFARLFTEKFNIEGNVESAEQAIAVIKSKRPAVIIAGSMFEDGTIADILQAVRTEPNYRPHIILTTVFLEYTVSKFQNIDIVFREQGSCCLDRVVEYLDGLLE